MSWRNSLKVFLSMVSRSSECSRYNSNSFSISKHVKCVFLTRPSVIFFSCFLTIKLTSLIAPVAGSKDPRSYVQNVQRRYLNEIPPPSNVMPYCAK